MDYSVLRDQYLSIIRGLDVPELRTGADKYLQNYVPLTKEQLLSGLDRHDAIIMAWEHFKLNNDLPYDIKSEGDKEIERYLHKEKLNA